MAPIVLLPGCMNPDNFETFRQKLLDRRRSLLQRRRRTLADELDLLSEREPDWEDTAALQAAAAALESMSESERRALARIQASLARIERGTYGSCEGCGELIDEDRLRALPEADRCGGCAAVH